MAELNISTAVNTYTYNGVTYTLTAKSYVDYTITNSATSATISASVKLGYTANGGHSVIKMSSASSKSIPGDWRLNNDTTANLNAIYDVYGFPYTLSTANKTATITKTHSAQSIPVYVCTSHSGVIVNSRQTRESGRTIKSSLVPIYATVYISVPAKTSYVVAYDANGGSVAPTNQTKWHGETLTLSSVKPTKDGYAFKGWATSVENASAGTVAYASGASYTGNAAITLYAVWELVYEKPKIQNISVERCLQDGTLDDEGKYALVSFDWSVFTSSAARYYGGDTYPYANSSVDSCTVTVGTQTATPTLTGASGTETLVVGIGTYDVDTAYDATIVISDTQVIVSDNETTVYGALPMAFFPLDYNADATALGIFMPAPDLGDGAYFGKTIHISVDTSASIGTTDYEIVGALGDLGWNDLLE